MKETVNKIVKTSQKHVTILGTNILSTDREKLLTAITDKISHNNKFYILTPNPELVLMAEKDIELRAAVNRADLSVPDGIGLKYASKYLRAGNLNIVPGRVLFNDLITLARKKKWRVFLLGGLGMESKITAEKLKNQTLIQIEHHAGPILNTRGEAVSEDNKEIESDAINKINKFKPHLLFVAFGNPKQELWIYKNLQRLNVFGVMAVGGSLRYAAGFSRLPPKWMQKLGLEWLWRLLMEPWRIKRTFNAFVIFPLRVFLSSLSGG